MNYVLVGLTLIVMAVVIISCAVLGTDRISAAERLPPRVNGGAPLSGQVVLLPRLKERDRIASALEQLDARSRRIVEER